MIFEQFDQIVQFFKVLNKIILIKVARNIW